MSIAVLSLPMVCFTGTWCTDFQKDNNQIALLISKLDLKFKAN
jgi:hypothetical protein